VVYSQVGKAGQKAGVTQPAGSISLAVGANYQAAIDAAAVGAVFWFVTGEHRLTTDLKPKASQTFVGAPGAVLNGSKLLTGWVADGTDWYVDAQTQRGWVNGTTPDGSISAARQARAGYPDAVFVDNVPLYHVNARAALDASSFFFDYAANRIYIQVNPSGKKVEAAVAGGAFSPTWWHESPDVTIRNLIVEKFAASIQRAAIGPGFIPLRWTIEDCEVRLNYGGGVGVGTGGIVRRCWIHDNGNIGVIGGRAEGIGEAQATGILLEANLIAANGWWSGVDPYWEGGGTKIAESRGTTFRRNEASGNQSHGLWTDVNNIETIFEENYCHANRGAGMSLEIGYAAIVRFNTCMNNGVGDSTWMWGGGIQIQNNPDVWAYGNKVLALTSGNGICVINQARGTGAFGPWISTGERIVGNLVEIAGTGEAFGVTGADGDLVDGWTLAGVGEWDRNIYRLSAAVSANDNFIADIQRTIDAHRAATGWDLASVYQIGGTDRNDAARLEADFNTASSTLANVPGLAVPIAPNTTKLVELFARYQTAATTTGVGVALALPAGASIIGRASTRQAGAGTDSFFDDQIIASATQVLSASVVAANTSYVLFIRAMVRTGATGGFVQLQAKTEVGASNARIEAGALLMLS
jgi:hypothetical protein